MNGPRIRLIPPTEADPRSWISFECPCGGCGRINLPVSLGSESSKTWGWNGDPSYPTLTPSVRVRTGGPIVCHFNLTDGVIVFHDDCTHALKNKRAPLPEIVP